jgi:hypothetical protein
VTEPLYKADEDFRRALEARLATRAREGARGLVRERQVLIFERFLARAFRAGMDVIVKGGMAVELRTMRARSTRDVDLRAMGDAESFDRALRALGSAASEDRIRFEVDAHVRAELDAIGMKYPGKRYRVQAFLAGKKYGDVFGVDVAFGEPVLGIPDHVQGRADLAFIGIAAPEFAVYPRTTHIAEKLHAYTVPRPTPNSRIRDVPDIAILASLGPIEVAELRAALAQTFAHRATHALPTRFPALPERWRLPYRAMAETNDLQWTELEDLQRVASGFMDPLLGAGLAGATW